jgi:hypothetical protein
MYQPQRMVTNFPKEQLAHAIRELEQSIELDRVEIGGYQILEQKLSATSVTAVGGPKMPMGVDFALREKDQVRKELQGLVQKEYDIINGKQEVVSFLRRLMGYATLTRA